MGKIKKTKPARNKKILAGFDKEEEDLAVDSKENAIQTILDQLQEINIEEKYCGLQTLTLMLENPENIPQIIERGVVKVAAPLLLDTASSVRNAAAGMLRNFSALKLEMCEILMNQDIMTPLICYFHEHAESHALPSSTKTKDEDADTFVQCVNLLLNLCESSELAIKYLGKSKILDIFSRYLDLIEFDYDIVTVVLQCLFVVVEDNPLAMQKIKANCEKQLQTLLCLEGSEPNKLLIKTLSAGVIINTCGGNISSLPIDVINQIISILGVTLSIDHRSLSNQLSSQVPLVDGSNKAETPKGKDAQVLENQIKLTSQMLDAQQTAIEIVANMCSSEDGDDFIRNESSENEEDEELFSNNVESILPEDKLPAEILEAMIKLEIFDKVWATTQLPPQNVVMILNEYEGSQLIYKKLHSLQTRALLCTNNIISTLPIENLGGVNGLYKIWVEAGKLVFKQEMENLNLVESATAVMRAALDKIKFRENGNTSDCKLFSDLAISDIEIMLTGIKECQVPEIRSNLIRMIGILALLLINNLNDVSSHVICTITEFILDQAHKEVHVWVLAEALDTLIDLYSEDDTDVLAAKVKLVDKLAVLLPILKNKVRQQKGLQKEYKVLVSTVVSNLPRFIKYKKDRISKL